MDNPVGGRDAVGQEERADASSDDVSLGRQPLRRVGTRAMRKELKHIREHVAGVNEGNDPEEVHQMRVATRRLRTMSRALETASAFRRGRVERLRDQLKQLARRLGDVRDLDILLERLDAYERESGQTSTALRDALHSRREMALSQLRKALQRPKTERLMRHPRRTAKRLAANTPEARQVLVRYVAGDALWKRYEAILGFEAIIAGGAETWQLHALRIACKQLRYALELFSDESDPCAQPLIETLKTVQGYLGDLQDSVFAVTVLTQLRNEKPDDQTLAGFLVAQQTQRETLRQGFAPYWEDISGPTYRQRLGEFIASL